MRMSVDSDSGIGTTCGCEHAGMKNMRYPLILSLLAPFTIYVGLMLSKNLGLTFLLFYGLVCVLIPSLDLFVQQKSSLKDVCHVVGLQHLRPSLFAGMLLGIACFTVIVLFFAFGHTVLLVPEKLRTVASQWMLIKRSPWIFGGVLVFINPLLEEVFWRGYLFSKWSQYVRRIYVIGLTAFFYASYHFFTTIRIFSVEMAFFLTGTVFLAGLIWGYCRSVSDSVWCGIISHLWADVAIVVVYIKYFLPRV